MSETAEEGGEVVVVEGMAIGLPLQGHLEVRHGWP